jgi:hypothetical protein
MLRSHCCCCCCCCLKPHKTGHHADHHRRHTPSRPSPGTATLLWNRPRELLLTIMGVRTGGATNSFLSFLPRYLAAAILLSFLFLSKLPIQPPQGERRRDVVLWDFKETEQTPVCFFFLCCNQSITLPYLFIVCYHCDSECTHTPLPVFIFLVLFTTTLVAIGIHSSLSRLCVALHVSGVIGYFRARFGT